MTFSKFRTLKSGEVIKWKDYEYKLLGDVGARCASYRTDPTVRISWTSLTTSMRGRCSMNDTIVDEVFNNVIRQLIASRSCPVGVCCDKHGECCVCCWAAELHL